MKHGHIKTRLDECKKFDEECKLRYIADEFIKMICKAVQVPPILALGSLVGPKPANINPFFEISPKERKILEKRIKRFNTESSKVSNGIDKFRKAALST